jgi:ribosomal protein S18 acetylase RimI-like enzyme
MKTEIRPATSDDAGFLAWAILTAGRAHVGRGIWEVIIDRPESDCVEFLERVVVTRIPHLFHYSCSLIAEVGGRSVASLSAHDPRLQGYDALRRALPEAFKKIGWPQPDDAWQERADRVLCCMSDAAEGAWVIDSVATVPEFRRRGIVNDLLIAILERGRNAGYAKAQLSIYIGNTPAQKAYEKHGFTSFDEKRHPHFEAEIGSPGMVLMLRDF